MFLSHEGPTLETLYFAFYIVISIFYIGSTPTCSSLFQQYCSSLFPQWWSNNQVIHGCWEQDKFASKEIHFKLKFTFTSYKPTLRPLIYSWLKPPTNDVVCTPAGSVKPTGGAPTNRTELSWSMTNVSMKPLSFSTASFTFNLTLSPILPNKNIQIAVLKGIWNGKNGFERNSLLKL